MRSKWGVLLLLLCAVAPTTFAQTAKTADGLANYLASIREEVVAAGVSPDVYDTHVKRITFRPTVIKADKNQPEKKQTLESYLKTRVPDWKVREAVTLQQQHQALLKKIEEQYGVQGRFIVALWGNESNFGRVQGNHDVLSATASLAYEGRREAFFKQQFIAALKIIEQGHISAEQFKGSWAGAMGQSQFIPTTFLTYAVDYDNDGKKDIWQSIPDVFASIANFLASEGWRSDYTWGRQVRVPGTGHDLPLGLDTDKGMLLSEWQRRGVTGYEGQDLPKVALRAWLVMPDGHKGRIFLVYDNFRVLMKWNRSHYFGVSVGYLADRIKRGY